MMLTWLMYFSSNMSHSLLKSSINHQRKYCNVLIIISVHTPVVKQLSANVKASASNEIKTYALLVTRKHYNQIYLKKSCTKLKKKLNFLTNAYNFQVNKIFLLLFLLSNCLNKIQFDYLNFLNLLRLYVKIRLFQT